MGHQVLEKEGKGEEGGRGGRREVREERRGRVRKEEGTHSFLDPSLKTIALCATKCWKPFISFREE
jgi:hypothetical protein